VSAASESPKTSSERTARTVGRGFLLITGAKLWFLVTGTVINIGLPRLLGNAARFGEYKVVSGLLSIVNMVMIAGTLQAVSKLVSEREGNARPVLASARKLQALVGGGLGLVFLLGADLIATGLLRDAGLTPYLRIGASIIVFYAFYAVQVGVLNGQKRFAPQAGLDTTFSTMKMLFMVGAVLAGWSVAGAFAGFAVAAGVVLLISIPVVRRVLPPKADSDAEFSPLRLFSFMGQVMLYTLALNALLQLDAVLVKALSAGPFARALTNGAGPAHAAALARASGLLPGDLSVTALLAPLARESTSMLAGLFGAVKNVSVIPYQLILSVTFVVFPLVSRATFDDDQEATRGYIRATLRFTLLLVTLFGLLLFSVREPLVVVLFGEVYRMAAPALGILLGATVLFSLFVVINTVITGAGRPGVSLLLGAVAAVISASAVSMAVLLAGSFAGVLMSTALALVLAMVLAFGGALAWLLKTYGWVVPTATAARTLAAAAAGLAVAWAWQPAGLIQVLLQACAVGLTYLATLALTGEFTREDLRRLVGLLPGR
jgi:O-antigen/teichoic acid export membrane protein